MRYSPSHKQSTHTRILDAASNLFRERGAAAAGVDAIMKAAGLTAGGFYAHFPSKETLLGEALAKMLDGTRESLLVGLEGLGPVARVRTIIHRYLSRPHRDAPSIGCPLPALAADVVRAGDETRAAFDAAFAEVVAAVERELAPALRGDREAVRERALATLALMVGGITLSRAVRDPAISDRMLAACRKLALEGFPPEETAR